MKKLILLLFLLSFVSFGVKSQNLYPLDDSLSTVFNPLVEMDFSSSNPLDSTVTGNLIVDVVLNVEQFKNKDARIYIVLDNPQIHDLRIDYQGTNLFTKGSINPNIPSLVYQGPITTDFLKDRLHLKIIMFNSTIESNTPLNFQFKIQI